MTALAPIAESRLAQYLPSLYRRDALLSGLLRAFEKVLLGRQDGIEYYNKKGFNEKGLEEKISGIATYFDPGPYKHPEEPKTPPDFLPWLAKWLAVSLRADLEEQDKRVLLSSIVDLYRWRGTPRNLETLLRLLSHAHANDHRRNWRGHADRQAFDARQRYCMWANRPRTFSQSSLPGGVAGLTSGRN